MSDSQFYALTTIIPTRYFANITADTVIEEQHEDRAQISDLPVEQGSTISDNVVDLPQSVTLTYGWSAGSPQNVSQSATFLRGIYTQIIQLKVSKVPFSIFTGKRVYANMLVETVSLTTDVNTENSLIVKVQCRQVLLVTTQTFRIPTDKTQVSQVQKAIGVAKQGLQQLNSSPQKFAQDMLTKIVSKIF